MDPEIVDAPDAVALDPADDPRPGPLPRRVVPVPDGGRALAAGPRGGRDRESSRGRAAELEAVADGGARPARRRDRATAVAEDADAEAGDGADGDDAAADAASDRPPVPFAPRAHRLRGRARRARRPRRALGLRQDDDDLPRSRGCTTSTRARSRSTTSTSARIKLASLGEIIGVVTQETYLFHASVRDNLRYARPDATEDELDRRRDGRGDPRPDHGAPRGLRHDRRRARLQAVGRREAADRDRPGPAQGPADPDPRRGDLGARHRLGAAHPGAPSSA